MIIAITGATGNMGRATLDALGSADYISEIRLLAHSKKRMKKLLKKYKALRKHIRIRVIEGGMTNADALRSFTDGADLVINMAAVIPPKADKYPQAAVECNDLGVTALVSELERSNDPPAFIHISTVALYGNRSGAHRFARVGDPLLVSPLDMYSATKLRGEFRVLECSLGKWAVLRQTAMLHPQMLNDNVHDGLMFHTVFDAPFEWLTAHDSGLLMRRICDRIHDGTLPDTFWKKCYNIAGGKQNRAYGMDTFDDGFGIIGGSTTDFFRPGYNATRNFHGVWYADGDELNSMFDYQTQSISDYWREIFRMHPVFKLGKLAPKRLVGHFAVKRLLKDKNSPAYWAAHGDDARIIAHFGSRERYDALQSEDWKTHPLPDRKNIAGITGNDTPVVYGFDFDKPDKEIDISDLRSAADAHGGRLVSPEFDTGDMYAKLEWETQDGERFIATPYTVLRAGHWYNPVYYSNVWDFDRLAKKDRVFASVWYDSHDADEDYKYYLDDAYNAHAVKATAG